MGLLDQVIGGVVGQVLGGGRGGVLASPVMKALLMLLLTKGAGGLGDIFGGGQAEARERPLPGPGADDGDLGGFNHGRRSGPPARGDEFGGTGGDFSDLAGMLDGPGDSRSPGEGPYAGLDREPQDQGGQTAGGLDGLIRSFDRSGLGDVIASWIGPGPNRDIAPNRLADVLGPGAVETLSRETGLSQEELLAQLARALPGVIDELTPQGRAPSLEERGRW
ncbi:MAG TPA: YidB family protein [Methylorubrum populi]|uniref:YidB family protein n=1 Tax=Methylorubrum populi TaxID=223967 RepID=A0A921E4L8_9HYPH|nr:YidB family protein [Methylorubrum populi]